MNHNLSLDAAALSLSAYFDKISSYFYDNFIDTQGSYENLNFNSFISVQTIILGLYAVMAVMAVAMLVGKGSYGRLVKALIDSECLSAEAGKTLPELDLADKLILRYAVKKSAGLRRTVLCREEEEYLAETEKKAAEYEELRKENKRLPKRFSPKPFKLDPDNHHFYIPEEDRYSAATKYAYDEKNGVKVAILSVLLLIGLVLLIIFLPDLMGLLNELVGNLVTRSEA